MRGAPVAPRVPGRKPFPLPTTSFQIVPGVVPLIVEDDPEFEDTVEHRPGRRRRRRQAASDPRSEQQPASRSRAEEDDQPSRA